MPVVLPLKLSPAQDSLAAAPVTLVVLLNTPGAICGAANRVREFGEYRTDVGYLASLRA